MSSKPSAKARTGPRRWPWLAAAALLLALGAWLMTSAEPNEKEQTVSLPRRMSSSERERNDTRQTWLPPPTIDDAGLAVQAVTRPIDPMIAALPGTLKFGAVVVEANAIRNSAIGDLLVDCLFASRPEMLDTFRDAGFDPLNGVDRVSMADDTLLVSGDFARTDVKGLLKASTTTQFGRNSVLYRREPEEGARSAANNVVGVWNNQMLVFGRNEEDVKASLERLDGKGRPEKPVLGPEDAYGEMYGTFTGSLFSRLAASENAELSKVLTETVGQVKLHADVASDVGLVADVEGLDEVKTTQLRKSLGSALTLAQLKAKTEGNRDDLELFDMAKVGAADNGTQFRVQVAMPHDFLEKNLKACAQERRREREGRKE